MDNNIHSVEELLEERRKEREKWEKKSFDELMELRAKKDWVGYCNLVSMRPEIIGWGFAFYDEIPDEMKYDFATSIYTHHGDHYPSVRKAVRGALKYGKPVLPKEIEQEETITIYRGGSEPIEKSKYRISWTVSLDMAEWFYNRHKHFGEEPHLYKGIIKTKDIIAYNNDRNEQEIMQYRKVFDIEEISPRKQEGSDKNI